MLQLLKRCLNLSDTLVQKVRGSFPAASAACWIFKPCSSVPEMQDNRVHYLDNSTDHLYNTKCPSKCPRSQGDIFKLLVLSDKLFKTRWIYNAVKQKKQKILMFEAAPSQCLAFLLEKLLTWLIDYQKKLTVTVDFLSIDESATLFCSIRNVILIHNTF